MTVNLKRPSGALWLAVLDGDQPLNRSESLALSVGPAKAIVLNRAGHSLLKGMD